MNKNKIVAMAGDRRSGVLVALAGLVFAGLLAIDPDSGRWPIRPARTMRRIVRASRQNRSGTFRAGQRAGASTR